jgi:hypothetical protein
VDIATIAAFVGWWMQPPHLHHAVTQEPKQPYGWHASEDPKAYESACLGTPQAPGYQDWPLSVAGQVLIQVLELGP